MLNLHEAFEVREKSTIALVVFVAWGPLYQIPDQILRQPFCTLDPLQKIEPPDATHLRIVEMLPGKAEVTRGVND
jgi:hypothetical protein